MKSLMLIAAFAALGAAQVYNGSFLNLRAPISGMDQGDIEFTMNHRFFGAAFKNDPDESFFGLDDGANVRFGVRYNLRHDITLGASHARLGSRNTITACWTGYPADNLSVVLEGGWSTMKPTGSSDRENGVLATAAVSLFFLQDKLQPVFNYAIDDNRDLSGVGMGLSFQAAERLALFGAFYPADNEEAEHDCFEFGVRQNTWGHQFLLGFTNSSGIGIYDQFQGSNTQDLSFALSIRRLF